MYICFIKKIFAVVVLVFCLITASCSGDNGAHKGKDTVKSVYGSANDTNGSSESTVDTSKVNSADNSASGGAKALRDTSTEPPALKR